MEEAACSVGRARLVVGSALCSAELWCRGRRKRAIRRHLGKDATGKRGMRACAGIMPAEWRGRERDSVIDLLTLVWTGDPRCQANAEIRGVIQVLSRRTKNNHVLIREDYRPVAFVSLARSTLRRFVCGGLFSEACRPRARAMGASRQSGAWHCELASKDTNDDNRQPNPSSELCCARRANTVRTTTVV
jgi:hypothetical protein